MSTNNKPVCKVCLQIRYFLLVAVPLLVLIGVQGDVPVLSVPIHELAANGAMLFFLGALAWRIYEFKADNQKRADRLARRLDEIDLEIEQERLAEQEKREADLANTPK